MGKLICLDAGHGINTPGKRCPKSLDPNETREWWLNNRMAGHAAAALSAYDCRAMRADDPTGAEDVPLAARAARANDARADLYVSIHHNAGINGGAGGGICLYVATKASDAARRLAQAVYDETVAKTGLAGNRSKGIWEESFSVLTNTSMPAVLGEFGFMDSSTDVPIILTDEFSRKCAEGIAAAVARVLQLQYVGSGGHEGADLIGSDEPSDWAKEACNWAVERGLFVGNGGGNSFDWQGAMTREQIALLFMRFHALARGS